MQNWLPSWVVLPAAGTGSRMQADKPKQYLSLEGKTVLEQTLSRLSRIPYLKGMVVALSAEDQHWQTITKPTNVPIITAIGGKERCDSVMHALDSMHNQAAADDWVMVHDAARPCFRLEDIEALHTTIQQKQAIGGILGLPLADTVKRVNQDGSIVETVSREGLWRAVTPQMFLYANLRKALMQALKNNTSLTDDAQVIELMQQQPVIVESSPMNIKITHSDDLRLAEIYLRELQHDS